MRSCLKLTPPLTPQQYSCAGSPTGSGNASPVHGHSPLPPCRKTVSFCSEPTDFFEVDDWDRTPAPVAPKLCYQEILELKQIIKSLPQAPQYPSHRQHFTTSLPQTSSSTCSSSSSSAAFPISRFATMPSATPSKWKNRDMSCEVDREILPFLGSVPIQLLPLLPPSSEPSPLEYPAAANSSESDAKPNTASTPTSPPISLPVPMITPPPSLTASASNSPRSSSPIRSPMSSSPPTPRRTANFSFVPLLPVMEVTPPPPPPPVIAPPPPTRKFNMTFIPLLPPEEPVQLPTPTHSIAGAAELTPQNETPPDRDDEGSHLGDSDLESISSPSSDYVPLSHISRSCTSTPSLSSASDTDTENEDASVSSPGPSSPFEDDMLSGYLASRATLHSNLSETELLLRTTDVGSTRTMSSHNPYFPPLPPSSTDTPRIGSSVLAGDASDALKYRRLQLQALPSPALQPPSPFSLYPASGTDEDASQTGENTRAAGLLAKKSFVRRSSALSLAEADGGLSPGMSPELTIEAIRNIPMRRRVGMEEDSMLGPNLSRR